MSYQNERDDRKLCNVAIQVLAMVF